MKILALEREVEGTTWEDTETLLEEEAKHIFELYLSNHLREIYFTQDNNAVLILEATDRKAAEEVLHQLPLVQSGKIRFELFELAPYTGYTRILSHANEKIYR